MIHHFARIMKLRKMLITRIIKWIFSGNFPDQYHDSVHSFDPIFLINFQKLLIIDVMNFLVTIILINCPRIPNYWGHELSWLIKEWWKIVSNSVLTFIILYRIFSWYQLIFLFFNLIQGNIIISNISSLPNF